MSYLSIAHYLPHRAPMILLDKVVSITNNQIICSTCASTNGILAPFLNETGQLPAYFLIELMAQTIGVWNGYHAQHQQEKPKIAFLLGTRLFQSQIDVIPLNSEIIIEANLILKDDNLANFEAYAIINNKQVAHAKLNVYQPSQAEAEKFLQESPK